MTNRRKSNDSPITTSSEETADNSASKFIQFSLFFDYYFHRRMYYSWEYVYM
jgi:hypothetical protein